MRWNEFVPFGNQAVLLESTARVQVALGGNSSGKGLPCAVKVAKLATTSQARIYLSAYDCQHHAISTYPTLFGGDTMRPDWVPLIGEDEVDWERSHWLNKVRGIPELITLKNGSELHFGSSLNRAGHPFTMIWQDEKPRFDEDITTMIKRSSQFLWSSWPDRNSPTLRNLVDEKSDRVAVFRFRFQDNIHISEEDKAEAIEHWSSFGPDHVKARADGEFPDPASKELVTIGSQPITLPGPVVLKLRALLMWSSRAGRGGLPHDFAPEVRALADALDEHGFSYEVYT